MLALDLGVFERDAHEMSLKEAGIWSAIWISLACVFGVGVWWKFGATSGSEYFAGYLVEKSLSVDNLFFFVVVFAAFKIPLKYQHTVLAWGVLTALVLRAVMIFAGLELLAKFNWIIYPFGVLLILLGVKMFREFRGVHAEEAEEKKESRVMQLIRRVLPSTPELHGKHFFVKENGKRLATPLLLALLAVEVTDVIFAVDSIPAVLAITNDPFLVFTSNVFAVLGLRSLFFLLAGVVERLRYLKAGLAVLLTFVGVKMLLHDVAHISPFISRGVIALVLVVSVVLSLWKARAQGRFPTPV
jgi:tellurite resistance protein TerC